MFLARKACAGGGGEDRPCEVSSLCPRGSGGPSARSPGPVVTTSRGPTTGRPHAGAVRVPRRESLSQSRPLLLASGLGRGPVLHPRRPPRRPVWTSVRGGEFFQGRACPRGPSPARPRRPFLPPSPQRPRHVKRQTKGREGRLVGASPGDAPSARSQGIRGTRRARPSLTDPHGPSGDFGAGEEGARLSGGTRAGEARGHERTEPGLGPRVRRRSRPQPFGQRRGERLRGVGRAERGVRPVRAAGPGLGPLMSPGSGAARRAWGPDPRPLPRRQIDHA